MRVRYLCAFCGGEDVGETLRMSKETLMYEYYKVQCNLCHRMNTVRVYKGKQLLLKFPPPNLN